MKNDLFYIRHMLDAISTIEGYISGYNETRFLKTKLVQDGVIRQVQITTDIPELQKHLSKIVNK